MRKFLKITVWLLIGALALLIGAGIYFKLRIKPLIIEQLNAQLAVEVDVSKIGISGLSNFPNLGIHFSDVEINESQEHYGKKLLMAEDLYLYVDVMKLWRKEYVVDRVEIRNGEAHLADLENGSNYEIFKPDSNNSEEVEFVIERLNLHNVKVDYQHIPGRFVSSGNFEDILAKLKYSGNQTNLRITGDLLVNIIEQSGEIFLRDKKSTLSTELVLEEDNSKISIKPSDLNIAGVNLQTEGLIRVADDVDLDIRFSNEEAELNEILSIVPNSVRESFEHLDLDGSASIAGYFKGRVSDTKDPSFGFTYDIKKADINVREQGLKLKNISAHGELQVPDMGNMRSAWVKCKLNNASSGSTSIKGSIRVDNFDRPKIHWDGFAKMDARTALAVLDFKSIQAQSGQVLIDGRFDLIYDPLKEEVLPNSLYYVGRVKASGIKGKINEPNLQLHHFDLDLAAENKQMVIKSCNLKYNKTEASLIGYILNSDDLFSRNSKSEFVGELKLNGLYVNELYGESSDTAESVRAELFPFKLKLRTEIQNFRYNNFTAQSLSGTLESDKKSVFMNNCKMTALEGHSEASIRLTTIGGNYLVDINSRLEAINIRELFRQFDNFEQNEITDEHISGVLNGKIMAKVILDRNYEPLLDKLYAKADMEIFDGQLVGYEPLNELSTFVEISDLQNVRFDLLKNSIEIFDRTIYIPKMHIGNSALSLDLEGTHTFDNYMDYRLSISLMELLAGRSNWLAKKQEKRIESNAEGGLTAYLTMKGTPEDLKITYDRTTAREAFTEEVKKEKRNFMQALRNEGTREEQENLRNYNDIWDE